MTQAQRRIAALRRFAIAISVLNLLGHFFLGFEQSWAYPLVALPVAYGLELFFGFLVSRFVTGRPFRFARAIDVVDVLIPAHITALACSMLLYANEHLAVIAFATAVAVASKTLLRAPCDGGSRHFLNPSNTGIAVTLLVFPWVGIAPPYQFTENLGAVGDVLLPCLIILSGSFLNSRFTQRVPLILAWLGGFVAQAVLRGIFFDTPLLAGLVPMTGLAFLLFTFYMATDPATTPDAPVKQVAFGLTLAATYGVLQVVHVVFGLFFALFAVTLGRGAWLALAALVEKPEAASAIAASEEPLGAGFEGSLRRDLPAERVR